MAMRRQYQGVGSCAWLPELGRLMYRLLADRNGICAVCEVVDWERGVEGRKEECEGRNGYNECRVSAGAGGPGGAAMQQCSQASALAQARTRQSRERRHTELSVLDWRDTV